MALNEGKDILAILQGQEVRIPDIEKLVSEWDLQTNPNEDQVKKVVDDILATYTVSTRVNAKLTKNKLSRYVSTCYPFADRETLAELTYFVCWMFLVDDEIDHIVAPGQNQEERLSNLWSEVLHLVESSCSITGVINGEEGTNKKPLEAFRVFGKSMRHKYTIAQSGRYWAELVATSRGYKIEQQIRDLEELPDYASYCKYRYGRYCMGQVVALME
ncbi:hypothetical protein CMQ_8099 [Grosmannia clavigera kw1407]|uniref:Terpenoid synthase n=1 Tax=Grosmannia clavigera (strain kw1407 / UAMH 11150) TaxID=655863 RepID=F0XKL8_GROCL|nr:uncharacterized protein CMQ_8099 [Grosmannia clavigera kw1407]EFX01633.1 hypothetical protein CMQ_8099 [Grosmannia clavigera kw1407]